MDLRETLGTKGGVVDAALQIVAGKTIAVSYFVDTDHLETLGATTRVIVEYGWTDPCHQGAVRVAIRPAVTAPRWSGRSAIGYRIGGSQLRIMRTAPERISARVLDTAKKEGGATTDTTLH